MSVIGTSEATCVYCGELITDNSNVEVLGGQMHAACELEFRRDWEEVSTEENKYEHAGWSGAGAGDRMFEPLA